MLGVAVPAAAHDETGEFTAVRAEPSPTGDGRTLVVDVLLTYTNDGHGATDAEVTLSFENPQVDVTVPPVTMAPGDREGAYTAEVDLPSPGAWTLTVSSPDPAATRSFAVEVAQTTTTTTAPTTTTGPTTTTDTPPEDDDEESSTVPWIYLALVLAGVGIGIALVAWWRTRRGPGGDSTTT